MGSKEPRECEKDMATDSRHRMVHYYGGDYGPQILNRRMSFENSINSETVPYGDIQ